MSEMNTDVMINIDHVTKSYGSTKALDDFSLQLTSGKIIGLLGPNGSGKTTLMKILAGLIHDYKGSVTIDGHTIDPYTKSIVAYLSDDPYFPKWMKIRDGIRLYRDFYPDFDVEKCLHLIKQMELDPNMSIKSMSKGMNEKFLLALCMSRNALVYILDEPIGGVDPAARQEIMDTILSNYNPEGLMVISTHLVKDIERIFDEVVLIKQGNVVLHRNAEALREERNQSIDDLFVEVFRHDAFN